MEAEEGERGNLQTLWIKAASKFLWYIFSGNVCACKNLFKIPCSGAAPGNDTQQ